MHLIFDAMDGRKKSQPECEEGIHATADYQTS